MNDPPVLTVRDLAERMGRPFEGDGDAVVRSVATLEQAGPEELSWVGSVDVLPRAANSRAGVLLIPDGCTVPDRTVIKVEDPDGALCDVLAMLEPQRTRIEPGIRPGAIIGEGASVEGASIAAMVHVGPGAKIGAGSQLHPGVYVGECATIGRDCVLWPNVVVRERVTLDDRVIVHPNATIGADGFSYLQRAGGHRKIPQIGTVHIEDDVEIGAGTTIDRARSGVTRIGRGTKIDNLCQIGHNCDIGEHCIIVAQCGIAGSSTLGHHVFLGGQAGVIDHIHVGNGVRVAVKSVITNDVPDNAVVRGAPAIDNPRFLRSQAAVHKLPEWLERVRALQRRVAELERRLSDPNGSE